VAPFMVIHPGPRTSTVAIPSYDLVEQSGEERCEIP
jgi:hypothetical protein